MIIGVENTDRRMESNSLLPVWNGLVSWEAKYPPGPAMAWLLKMANPTMKRFRGQFMLVYCRFEIPTETIRPKRHV